MTIIFDYNRTLFDPDTDGLYPGVADMLGRLSVKAELYLVSRNEPERQKGLDELNIRRFFQRVEFVDEKSSDVFTDLVDQAQKVVVVGDSIRDEIKIGNQLGWTTVRVKQGKFAAEIPVGDNEDPALEIESITDLENLLSDYE